MKKKRKQIYQDPQQIRQVSEQRKRDIYYQRQIIGKIGRNALCSCKSGLKFKNCCYEAFSPFIFFENFFEEN